MAYHRARATFVRSGLDSDVKLEIVFATALKSPVSEISFMEPAGWYSGLTFDLAEYTQPESSLSSIPTALELADEYLYEFDAIRLFGSEEN